MLFKVWPNCVTRPKGKRIEEVDQRALDEAINEVLDDAIEDDMVDIVRDSDPTEVDDNKISKALDKIRAWWKKWKDLSLGDYMIVEKDSIDEVQIPDISWGPDYLLIFDDSRWYAVLKNREDKDLSYGSYNKEYAFIECKYMNDRYEEEGKPREAFVAEIDNHYDSALIHEYKDNEVLYYLNYVEASKKEEEANKSVKNMKQTEKEDEEEI